MTRLDWDRAKRDNARTARAAKSGGRSAKINLVPGERGVFEPSPKQMAYVASLAEDLGIEVPNVPNRRQAIYIITSLENRLALKRSA